MLKRSIYLLLVIVVFSTSLLGAGSRRTILKGKIRDSESREFVSGLKILLMGDFKNYTTKTDNDGYFRIDGLNKNRFYTLNVYKNSKLICSKRIKVKNDKEYISLSLKIYGQKEAIHAISVNLTGRIIDSKTLMAVHRAYVFLDGGEVFTITDKNGRYFFEDVASGAHVIKVRSRGHAEEIREIKLSKKEEYMDFELKQPVIMEKADTENKSEISFDLDNNNDSSNVSETYNSGDDYINEDLLEVGFDEAVKKVISVKKVKSVKTGRKAQTDFATLPK
ncbi:carboxypeptidase-like regulatory domain-containing protein, partial [bacterium]|nr:carboxypeptidase-like regulatory domain-containing protein [bacterium]